VQLAEGKRRRREGELGWEEGEELMPEQRRPDCGVWVDFDKVRGLFLKNF
jgi:hypothetical protein